MNERICFGMLFNVSICFHRGALSKNPMRKVAHSLHYPIDVTTVIVSHLSLVWYATSPFVLLEGESSLAAKYTTQPQNSQTLRGRGVAKPATGSGLRCGGNRESV